MSRERTIADHAACAIIDNRRRRLSACIDGLLADGATAARLAVGYLFLEGLAPLRPHIERLGRIEILIGNVVNRLTDEQVREEAESRRRGGEGWVRPQADVAAPLREAHDRAAVETALSLRRTLADLRRTAGTRALLLTLAARIADGGLHVRLYTPGRIHAKAALIDYPLGHPRAPGLAVVGSSNLTLAGPAHPTEMNILVRDPEGVAAVAGWYRELWEQSQDFHRELFDELGRCWAMQPAASRRPGE